MNMRVIRLLLILCLVHIAAPLLALEPGELPHKVGTPVSNVLIDNDGVQDHVTNLTIGAQDGLVNSDVSNAAPVIVWMDLNIESDPDGLQTGYRTVACDLEIGSATNKDCLLEVSTAPGIAPGCSFPQVIRLTASGTEDRGMSLLGYFFPTSGSLQVAAGCEVNRAGKKVAVSGTMHMWHTLAENGHTELSPAWYAKWNDNAGATAATVSSAGYTSTGCSGSCSSNDIKADILNGEITTPETGNYEVAVDVTAVDGTNPSPSALFNAERIGSDDQGNVTIVGRMLFGACTVDVNHPKACTYKIALKNRTTG